MWREKIKNNIQKYINTFVFGSFFSGWSSYCSICVTDTFDNAILYFYFILISKD